jgi:hypothetical protein
MKDGKFLPIGSIVKLEQQDRPIIIVGFLPECEGEAYDYLGYPYPEGFIGDDKSICFTAGLVDQILYWGYETQEGTYYIEELISKVGKILGE